MQFLKQLFDKYGIGELIFTSDGGKELKDGTLPGVFEMVNFQNNVDQNLNQLQKHQPGKHFISCFFYIKHARTHTGTCKQTVRDEVEDKHHTTRHLSSRCHRLGRPPVENL